MLFRSTFVVDSIVLTTSIPGVKGAAPTVIACTIGGGGAAAWGLLQAANSPGNAKTVTATRWIRSKDRGKGHLHCRRKVPEISPCRP